MARWLVKQEPSAYSYADLEREGATRWDGVHHPLALRHLRAMRPGDEGIFYHTGAERACVGTLRVVGRPAPDPGDARGSWTVDVAVGRRFDRPVPLAQIRGDPAFRGFELLRLGRLSVMPVPAPYWRRIVALGRPAVPTAAPPGPGRGAAPPPTRTSAPRKR